MIPRALTSCGVLLLVFSPGCAFTGPISIDSLHEVPPTPAESLDGTYADRSPDWMGGSTWERLTGEYPDTSGIVQTRIQTLPGNKLALTRLVNGVETGYRIVPFWIEHGYVRVSRSKWWTLLLVSNVGWDESALSRCGSELMVYHEYGYVLFITLLPVPAETGPPLGWQQYPAATTTTTKPTTRPVVDAAPAKAAAMTFFDAIAKGDAKRAAQVSIAEPAELHWIEAAAAAGKAQGELLAAATTRFGEAQTTRYFRKPGEHSAKILSAASVEGQTKRDASHFRIEVSREKIP